MMMNFMYTYTKTSKARRDHVILGPQPVIDAGSGRCFWRASTHPDPEMATTGKRQREAGGGGEGGSSKNAEGSSRQKRVGGGAGAGLELPGLNVSLPQHMTDADDCLIGDITREKQKTNHVPLVRKIRWTHQQGPLLQARRSGRASGGA